MTTTTMTPAGNFEAGLKAHYHSLRRRLLGKAALPTNKIGELYAKRRSEHEAHRAAMLAGLTPAGRHRPTLTPGQMEAVYTILSEHGVTWEELTSQSRAPRLVEPRQFIMLLLQDFGWSNSKIGQLIGRDEQAVRYANRRYGDLVRKNPVFLRALNCV